MMRFPASVYLQYTKKEAYRFGWKRGYKMAMRNVMDAAQEILDDPNPFTWREE